jgi:hypothetical protein
MALDSAESLRETQDRAREISIFHPYIDYESFSLCTCIFESDRFEEINPHIWGSIKMCYLSLGRIIEFKCYF